MNIVQKTQSNRYNPEWLERQIERDNNQVQSTDTK